MNARSTQRSINLEIFDKRFGYTPEEAHATLMSWGKIGRNLYLLLEAIDFFVYPAAYRGIFLVLLNRTADVAASRRSPLAGILAGITTVPLIISFLDILENCGQV